MTDVKSELETSIDDVQNAVAAINATEAGIADLRKKYEKVIFPVETPAGMKDAKAARQEIRQPRYTIEKLRKEAKAPILALGKQLDAKAKELTAEVLAIEEPIDLQITDYEAKLEAERQAAIEAETKRVEAIQERITELREVVNVVDRHSPSKLIADHIGDIQRIAVDESFEEFRQQALDAKDASLARLEQVHTLAVEREAEEARIKAERAELEKLRAEQAKREEAERKEREAKEAAERKKREAEEARQREELAEQQRKIDAENASIAEEGKRLARRQEIENQIAVLKGLPTHGYGKAAADLSRLLARAEGWKIGFADEYPDLADAAAEAKKTAIDAIKAMLTGRQQYEKEQSELAEAKRQKEAEECAEAEARRKAEEAARKAKFPGEPLIVDCLVKHFGITEKVARSWLAQCLGEKAA